MPQEDNFQYVHIVFSLSDAGSLKVALSTIGVRELCEVLSFNELFSVGPISSIDTATGQQNRHLWMMEHDKDYSFYLHHNQEHTLANMVQAVRSIPGHIPIVIWCADNAHDQTGLRFVLHLLRERKERVHIANVTELYYTAGLHSTEGNLPYYRGAIGQEQFLSIVKNHYQGLPLDNGLRSMYEAEWLRLSEDHHVLRLWEESTVIGREETALDEVILRAVRELEQEQDEHGYINAASVFIRVFKSSLQFVGEAFVTYRIWMLVNQGDLAFRGLPWALHQFSLRLGLPQRL
ncbi:DUF1835 domain-containing protein [Paenibacillus tritici]|uniref:DUF1835 domain-containing protein n=1 Tax=Paenibacillus tritici TaxID=1873425 RepID=UPI001BA857B0|nr:DUF1835 domain-containing protein [Paenibacillus tritici]QUL57915.1 DUF1835 domain-containing protein [Paenibacillus tritici]